MFHLIKYFFQFRRNIKRLKNSFIFILYTIEKDFSNYKQKHYLTEYQIEELSFSINRMKDFFHKIFQHSTYKLATSKNNELKIYVNLFKTNMYKCNEILMIATKKQLINFNININFLVNDKSHNLFSTLNKPEQIAFTKIYELTSSTIKAIDEHNLKNFSTCKYKLDMIIIQTIKNLSSEKYYKLLNEVQLLQNQTIDKNIN